MCDRISCLRSYFNNFSTLLHAAAAVAAGAALPETVAAAAEVRSEEGRPLEDTAEDPATSWVATPAREGKL